MIVDTSALIAILHREPEHARFSAILDASPANKISAATLIEACIVVDRWKDPILSSRLDEILDRFSISIEPVTADHARIARQAFRDYGRGSGHPANLNFGDCFSYALARTTREPLLFKGQDFSRTDLAPAVPG
ncbi:MAG TPA: type II toxin-antitoxin system VapC family toxin [Terracidiphilus sp.]|nr:type II toxin-antitoxin system VapC family toxin [Terracidiphilus sp.]